MIFTSQNLWLQKFASGLLYEKHREQHIIIQLITSNHFSATSQNIQWFLLSIFFSIIFAEPFQSLLFSSLVTSLSSVISDVLTQCDSLSLRRTLIVVPPLHILMHEHLECYTVIQVQDMFSLRPLFTFSLQSHTKRLHIFSWSYFNLRLKDNK